MHHLLKQVTYISNFLLPSFERSAAKVLSSFNAILEEKIAAVAELGVTLISFATYENQSWPFVTVNDFQQRSASTRGLSDAYFLELLPIVRDEERGQWEAYSIAHKAWLSEGRAYQANHGFPPTPNANNRSRTLTENGDAVAGDVVIAMTEGKSSISEKISSFDDNGVLASDPGPGPYFPIWQVSLYFECVAADEIDVMTTFGS